MFPMTIISIKSGRHDPEQQITNGEMLKLYKFVKGTAGITFSDLSNYFSLERNSFMASIHRTISSEKKHKKRPSGLKDFYDQCFPLQKAVSVSPTQKHTKVVSEKAESKLKETVSQLRKSCKHLQRKTLQLQKSRNIKNNHLITANDKLNIQNKAMSASKRSNHELKRKLSNIEGSFNQCQRERKQLKLKLKDEQDKCAVLKMCNENFDKSLKEMTKQVKVMRDETKDYDDLVKSKEELGKSLDYVNMLLEDQVNPPLVLFDQNDNAFSTETQLCVMTLLRHGVPTSAVSPAISAVARLCNRTPDRLPSLQTVNNMNDQRLVLSQTQLQELTQPGVLTLHSDETSKAGQSYEGFHAGDDKGQFWVLGLREMENKSAQTCLSTLKDVLNDIDETSKHFQKDCPSNHIGHELLYRIRNTMSDRAATEKKFHDLIEGYRTEILPSVVQNWDTLTPEVQQSLSNLNNFYCGMHLLVNLAESTDKALLQIENAESKEPLGAASLSQTKMFIKSKESGIIRTVRTTCKALSKGVDEKSGCYKDFATFVNMKKKEKGDCQDKVKKENLLVKFRGNRFNIVFYDAEAVFYLLSDIIEFFKVVHPPSNVLQKAVDADIKVPLYQAGLKAMGLVSKFVTAPLWRLLESKDIHVLDMNVHYLSLVAFLDDASKDASSFITGEKVPFPNGIKKNFMWERLVKSDPYDDIVCRILQFLFMTWKTQLESILIDQLPGGRYHEASREVLEDAKAVVPHNKFPETVFGMLDRLIRSRPNATLLCQEAFVMFSLNKTGEWLKEKTEEERKHLLKESRKLGRRLRDKYKQRAKNIQEERHAKLRDKQRQIEEKEKKILKEKEQLTSKVIDLGLWQTEMTVRHELSTLRTVQQKKDALKAQIKFRQKVLGQTYGDPKVFQYGDKENREYSVDKLSQNLVKLIKAALSLETKEELNEGRPRLVGRRINHTFDDGVYEGEVVSQVPGFPRWYNVVYEDDEAVYAFRLGDDFNEGNLEILSDTETSQEHQSGKLRKE